MVLSFCTTDVLHVVADFLSNLRQDAGAFVQFWMCIWLISVFAITMYVTIASTTPNIRVAQLVSPYFTGVCLVGYVHV